MLNIVYSQDSYDSIDRFINNLKNYYKKFYFDTGIVNEDQIVLNYLEITEKLFDEIIDKIEHDIEIGYFGIILDTTTNYELSKLIIRIRSYNIVVIIKKQNREAFIENIIF